MSASTSHRSGLVAAALALGLPLLLVGGFLVWWQGGFGPFVGRETCVVSGPGGDVRLDQEQVSNAATIAAVADRRSLPSKAVTVGLATALQESKLRNLTSGDHDSAGLFQQRPSQGWGSFEQITNPDYAADHFYAALTAVEGWQHLPITQAAQAVQRSAFPEAYREHADDARTLALAFTGHRGAAVTCTVRAESEKPQQIDSTGLTPRASRLRDAMEQAFGTLSLGGFAPGGVQRPNQSANNQGRAIDVFFRPYQDPANRHEGWALAHWLVAHSDALDVSVIIYRDHIWSASHSPEGWRDYVSPFGNPDSPVQRHLDHVHVEVS
jgi:hypothetical protein